MTSNSRYSVALRLWRARIRANAQALCTDLALCRNSVLQAADSTPSAPGAALPTPARRPNPTRRCCRSTSGFPAAPPGADVTARRCRKRSGREEKGGRRARRRYRAPPADGAAPAPPRPASNGRQVRAAARPRGGRGRERSRPCRRPRGAATLTGGAGPCRAAASRLSCRAWAAGSPRGGRRERPQRSGCPYVHGAVCGRGAPLAAGGSSARPERPGLAAQQARGCWAGPRERTGQPGTSPCHIARDVFLSGMNDKHHRKLLLVLVLSLFTTAFSLVPFASFPCSHQQEKVPG